MSCPTLEAVAAWTLGDLSGEEGEAFEAHWFACDDCRARSERMLVLVRFLNAMTPTFLTTARRELLEKAGPLPVTAVSPGQEGELRFAGKDTGMWIFRMNLTGVDRVDCHFLHEGTTFQSFPDVPFDAGRGEIALACRTHYQAVAPPRFSVRLTSTSGGVTRPIAEYVVSHIFDAV